MSVQLTFWGTRGTIPTPGPQTARYGGNTACVEVTDGSGNLVILDHGDGYHSLYAHLGRMEAAVGTEVEEGQPVGEVGDTGSLKGSYLYFEVREKGKPVDPKSWLGAP